MKKSYLLAIAFLCCLINSATGQIAIPDARLKAVLLNYVPTIDTNSNGEIEQSEALLVTNLNISSQLIADLTGIRSFTNLAKLNCSDNPIENFDLTGLSNLHQLESRNISVYQSVSVSGLAGLKYLDISHNSMQTVLNLSGMPNLQHLDCNTCYPLQSIAFSADVSQIEYVDISNNPNMFGFYGPTFYGLKYFDGSNTNLNGLTLPTNNNVLEHLDCNNSHVAHSITFNATEYHALKYLDLTNTSITGLNVEGLSNLETLKCGSNNLISLNVTGLIKLISLDFSDNANMAAIDVSSLILLENLNCSNTNAASLQLGNLTALKTLNCGLAHLTSLDLTNNTALTLLFCNQNSIDHLEVSHLANLVELQCSENQLTELNVNTLVNLKVLACYQNLIPELTVSNLTQLERLLCTNNQIAALDVSNTSIKDLSCANNQLTSLIIGNKPFLQTMYCSNNQLTNLDLSGATSLYNISCHDNLFTSLDFSNSRIILPGDSSFHNLYVDFYNNPVLTNVNLKNGGEPAYFMDNVALNCPNLISVCADENNIEIIKENLLTYGPANYQVTSYCSFTPGGINNKITGHITLDLDNNGCGAADAHFSNVKVSINDGIDTGAAFTDAAGNVEFYTKAGSFLLTPHPENSFFTALPASGTIEFPDLDGTSEIQDFCFQPNGIHNDLEIIVIPAIPANPGFNATYNLTYKNKGNQTLSGNVNFTFDDAVLDFVSANPTATTVTLNNLSWIFTNLQPFESRSVHLILNLNNQTETPPINIGDHLSYTATISPNTNDETPLDNIFTLEETVIGAHDPNDKTCLEGNYIRPEKIGDYVHYVIRFQNSGTAPAENVVVKDVIDTTKFDLASLQLTNTSHLQTTKITGNTAEFFFQNINLPAKQDNEPGSHGFVAFKIKTKSNLVLGNSISNIADIFFDYNFPITTNPAESTFSVLGVNDFENASLTMNPNPVNDKLHISANENITSVQVFDVQGRLVQANTENSNVVIVDLSKNNSGVYFVKAHTEKGVKVQKIIKK